MSDESATRRENALDFLDELDDRHDFLLNELEKLNLQIDSVLNDYSKSRQSALANAATITHPPEGNAISDASSSLFAPVDFE